MHFGKNIPFTDCSGSWLKIKLSLNVAHYSLWWTLNTLKLDIWFIFLSFSSAHSLFGLTEKRLRHIKTSMNDPCWYYIILGWLWCSGMDRSGGGVVSLFHGDVMSTYPGHSWVCEPNEDFLLASAEMDQGVCSCSMSALTHTHILTQLSSSTMFVLALVHLVLQ